MSTIIVLFIFYSAALACISFFVGAVWQDRRAPAAPPPLPKQQPMAPETSIRAAATTSPFAPKPKPSPPQLRARQRLLDAINKTTSGNSPPTPPPTRGALPDIPWGTK